MSATDELRRLLTEAGVEWDADDETLDDGSLSQVTYWHSNGIEWSADGRDEFLAFDAVQLITPAQATAATLGTETCKRIFIKDWLWKCSKCGSRHDSGHLFNYCPNCGRRCVG